MENMLKFITSSFCFRFYSLWRVRFCSRIVCSVFVLKRQFYLILVFFSPRYNNDVSTEAWTQSSIRQRAKVYANVVVCIM